MFRLLAQIDPDQALRDAWSGTSPEVHVATGSGGLAAWLAGIPWAAVAAVIATLGPIVVGFLVQCYKQVRVAQIQIDAEKEISRARVSDQIRRFGNPAVVSTPVVSTIPGRILVPDVRPSA